MAGESEAKLAKDTKEVEEMKEKFTANRTKNDHYADKIDQAIKDRSGVCSGHIGRSNLKKVLICATEKGVYIISKPSKNINVFFLH